MNPENVIEVCDVRKFFKVYQDKGSMLRERLIHINRNKYEKREVLKGISFNVKRGESVGLIGKNGCGKSTTLKLLTKILRPNGGNIEIKGRVCSLIELGAGFHPDMSGRENIYINASIFGIKAKEVDRRLKDIIRFSELEEYIDNPVRTYSSGMYMRLAFSVAINVDADILLIDEILAVGDNSFQTKCFNKLKNLKEQGTTIVIVSHALGQIEKLCDRAIWIDKGLIKKEGPSRLICKEYLESMETSRLERAEKEYQMQLEDEKLPPDVEERTGTEEDEKARQKREEEKKRNASCHEIATQCGPDARRSGNRKAEFVEVKLLNEHGEETLEFQTGDTAVIKMKYRCCNPGEIGNFIIGITRNDWIFCYGTSLKHLDGKYVKLANEGEICICLKNIPLLKGTYFLDVGIQNESKEVFDVINSLLEFKVCDLKEKEVGICSINYKWTTEDELVSPK